MAWEENSCISLNMQLIAILSRIGVFYMCRHRAAETAQSVIFLRLDSITAIY